MKFKEWTNKWNPFNSHKLLAHLNRWSEIWKGNAIPQPVTVTVDPINICNLSCPWCNSDYILKKNSRKIERNILLNLADFLSDWKVFPFTKYGVETICVAGGGEPTLHPDLGTFINKCYDKGIQIGLVTNGSKIDHHLENLVKCTWVGVSIDAGTPETFKKLKGKDIFDKIIHNVKSLTDLASKVKASPLNQAGQGPGISFKYLIHPKNVNEIYIAAKLAKSIGCKNFHIRPYGEPWDKLGQTTDAFSYSDILDFQEQLKRARILEDNNFRVFGITHKFDGNFKKLNQFHKCYAIFMTCVFMPPKEDGLLDFGFCCDRRGDEELVLHNIKSFNQISNYWGSVDHWKMSDKIIVKKCPRCTYQPHNIIFEKTIIEDNLTYRFI